MVSYIFYFATEPEKPTNINEEVLAKEDKLSEEIENEMDNRLEHPLKRVFGIVYLVTNFN